MKSPEERKERLYETAEKRKLEKKKEEAENCKKYGRYLGYPECCIDFFCNHEIFTPEQLKIREKVNGENFIPCPKDSILVESGKKELKDLIKK